MNKQFWLIISEDTWRKSIHITNPNILTLDKVESFDFNPELNQASEVMEYILANYQDGKYFIFQPALNTQFIKQVFTHMVDLHYGCKPLIPIEMVTHSEWSVEKKDGKIISQNLHSRAFNEMLAAS